MVFSIMATVTETIDTSYNFPHIDIYKRFYDGVHNAYRAYAHEGYVMYSPSTDIFTTEDPETGKTVTEIYYCRMVGMPLSWNPATFDYIAVLESEVPLDHIFGGGDNEPEHEIM